MKAREYPDVVPGLREDTIAGRLEERGVCQEEAVERSFADAKSLHPDADAGLAE